MGFFNKKKNTDAPSSVLSESEIQRKLYGEFSEGSSHVVPGGRERHQEPASTPFVPKESSLEKDEAFDFFSVQREVLSEPSLSSPRISPDSKTTDPATRYVPLHDFEKKSVASGSDASSRFRYNRPSENQWASFLDLFRGVFEKTNE